MYELLNPTKIKPEGWLRDQLTIQARGLMGNLDKVWPDVRDSRWIGGDREGWERVPYWLDGFIPLAYLLDDRDMIARADRYVNAIIDRQQEDGWICPCSAEERATYNVWALFLIGKVLALYCDFTGSEKAENALYRAFENLGKLMKDGMVRLFSWGQSRWFEAFVPIEWLYEKYKEDWLLELAGMIKEQGLNYDGYRENWKIPMNEHTQVTHIVNLAMMLKAEAVERKLFGKSDISAREQETLLRRYNGTAVGLWTGDECLSGLSNVQGTELCSVCELMYSLEWLFRVTGDVKWLDQLEMVTFNALPATFTDDMWAHQYDQQANQIECTNNGCRPIFRTNSGEAIIFGLEPNYGCCTANGGQGWPKFAMNAFLTDGSNVVIPTLMPSSAEIEINGRPFAVKVVTEYPFRHSAKIIARGDGVIKVRVPAWVSRVTVNGDERRKTRFITLDCSGESEFLIEYTTAPKLISRPHGLKSAQWGSLVFALPREAEYVKLEYERNGVERKSPYCDYQLISSTPWEYGFAGTELGVEYHLGDGVPFSSKAPRVTLKAKMAPIDWGFAEGYRYIAAPTPRSRIALGKAEEKTLFPYGCAKLRVTELPMCREKK